MIKSTTTDVKVFTGPTLGVGTTYAPLPVVARLSSVFISAKDHASPPAPLLINVRVNGDKGDQSLIFSGSTVHISGDTDEITSVEVNCPSDFTVTFILVK